MKESSPEKSEKLISLKLNNGDSATFYRNTDKSVVISTSDLSLKIPKASGMSTIQLIALLDPFTESYEG